MTRIRRYLDCVQHSECKKEVESTPRKYDLERMSGSEDLLWNVKNGDVDAVTSNIKDMKDVNAEINGGRNALHFAADYGQAAVIECLLKKGADINKPDKHGISPLLAAIYEGHVDAVKLLLEKGADKNREAPNGESYFDCAETDEIKLLLK